MGLRRTDGLIQQGGDDVTWTEVDTVHKIPATVRDLVDTDSQTVRTHMRSYPMCRGKND